MKSFEIDSSALTKAGAAYGGKFDAYAGSEMQRVMDQSGEIVQRAVRKRAKRHYRTGSLERNVRITATGAGWDRKVKVRSGGHHAHLVAGPVRAHRIPSRQPETKAMPLYVSGHVIGFAEAVQHPATRGDPYFHVGVSNSRLAILAVMRASAKKLTAHLAETSKGTP